MVNFSSCPCCKGYLEIAEGGYVSVDGKNYFICLDCIENLSTEDIEKRIKNCNNKEGSL